MPQSLQSAIWQAAARQSAGSATEKRCDEDSVDERLSGKDVPAPTARPSRAQSTWYPEEDLPLETRSDWYPADDFPLSEARELPVKDESGKFAALEEELSRLRRENAALKGNQEQLESLRRENEELRCNQAVLDRDYGFDSADARGRTPSPQSAPWTPTFMGRVPLSQGERTPPASEAVRIVGCSGSQRSVTREHSRESMSSLAEVQSAGSNANCTPRRAVRAVHRMMSREQTPRSTYATSFKTPGAQRRIGSCGPGASRISMAKQSGGNSAGRPSTPGSYPGVVSTAGTRARPETPKRAASQSRAPSSRLSTPGRNDVATSGTSGTASRGSSPAPGGHDFITANFAAAAMPPRPRTASSKSELRPQAVCPSKQFARDESNVPIYLKQVKARLEHEQALKEEEQLLEQQEAGMPPGHRRVSEAERLHVLDELQVRKRDLDAQYCRLPLRIDTEALKRRQRDLETNLREVERQMEQYSRPSPLVKA